MWALARLGLRYHRPSLAIAATIAVGMATMISLLARGGVKVHVIGVSGLDLTQLWVLGAIAAQTLPIAAMIAGFVITGIEREERRLQLLATLPVTRRQVSVFRALLPLIPVLAAAVVSAMLLAALTLAAEPEAIDLHVRVLVFTVAQVALLVQLPLVVRDIMERRESGQRGESCAILLGVLTMTGVVWWAEVVVEVAWLRVALAWLVAAVLPFANVHLFERRHSFG
ncbi:MAG: hypothetical protein V1750_11685 [Acidobacteriota bacterium]